MKNLLNDELLNKLVFREVQRGEEATFCKLLKAGWIQRNATQCRTVVLRKELKMEKISQINQMLERSRMPLEAGWNPNKAKQYGQVVLKKAQSKEMCQKN